MMERGPLSPVHLQSSRSNFSQFPTAVSGAGGGWGVQARGARAQLLLPTELGPSVRLGSGRRARKGQGRQANGGDG